MSYQTEPLHFMLDIETLGTEPGAAITQIGCVAFSPFATIISGDSMADPAAMAGNGMISSPSGYFRKNVRMPIDDTPAKLREEYGTIDPRTLSWWLDQDLVAFDKVFRPERDDTQHLRTVLLDFLGFVGDWKREWFGGARPKVLIWGNAPSFDCGLMQAACKRCAVEWPFTPFQERDYRTIKDMGKIMGIEQPPFVGTKHDALDDAYHQANYAIMVLQAAKRGVV